MHGKQETNLRGQDHPGSENADKHLCFGSNLAVVCGVGVTSRDLVDVKCAQICCFVTFVRNWRIYHQKGPETDMTMFSVLGSLSPYYYSLQNLFYTWPIPGTGKTGSPKRKWLKACAELSMVTSLGPSSADFVAACCLPKFQRGPTEKQNLNNDWSKEFWDSSTQDLKSEERKLGSR